MFWSKFFKKLYLSRRYLLRNRKYRRYEPRSVVFRPKIKFVRERRIFAKGSRGPVKKRSTVVMRNLILNITSSPLQNLPPLSTFLGLYGINVQKFCDDFNSYIKKYFFEHVPITVFLQITKDLNFTFKVFGFRFGFLLQSLDIRNIKIIYNYTFLCKRSFFSNYLIDFFSVKDNQEIEYKDYTLLDFWLLLLFFKFTLFFDSFYLKNSTLYFESFFRTVSSNLNSYQNLYLLKSYKYKS